MREFPVNGYRETTVAEGNFFHEKYEKEEKTSRLNSQ